MKLNEYKIGIVGAGVVGRATAQAHCEFVDEVRVYDVVPERCTHKLVDVLGCDLIFVCLPTPLDEYDSSGCTTRAITEFFELVARDFDSKKLSANFVIKSTVPVGFTYSLALAYCLPNVVHSPEFLTARTALHDASNPTRTVVGVPKVSLALRFPIALEDFYRMRHPDVPCIVCYSRDSEAAKLATNGYYATKVAYFNEIQQYCKGDDVNFDTVRAIMLTGGRVGESHTQVPGPDGKYGFGGTCLPKDLSTLIHCINKVKHNGVDPTVTEAVYKRNSIDRGRS